MQVKKFEARTMAEALNMVKSEFGSDAVILSTKSRRKGTGAFGLFGAPVVEIAAAMDRNPSAGGKPLTDGGKGWHVSTRDIETAATVNYQIEEFMALRDELKGLLSDIRESRAVQLKGAPKIPEGFEKVSLDMKAAGVAPVLTTKLIGKSIKYLGKDRLDGERKKYTAMEAMALAIMDHVKVSGGIDAGGEEPKKVAFVGPTGVGKTTTMAKLAGKYSLLGKKVAFITIDTYRIAAVEQLKIYARILNIPVEVATTPRELREKIAKFEDKDLILIDTGGRSQKDHEQLSFLKEFFPRENNNIELHLVMSATTKDSDIVDIVKRFGCLPLARFLFTKLDESTTFGALLNVAAKYKVPYSYFTTGQKVPEDVEVATPERVADMILNISRDIAEMRN